ncbi:unnamed protein product [Bursaphelenchus xylophilus]|uniref:(pine wood nematode) hypothetical protein n=1 Tax=Bursaphelenchus xylophilus TaxID=6326 RepID=A0A1I7S062_BURXY|nr:unnamed protein product [Bursaphelenchus xylophilus]CAG9108990.1 unnamed protein product [Bursaphelenchus xylophilus]
MFYNYTHEPEKFVDLNNNKMCFIFIACVHLMFMVVLVLSYGKDFIRACKFSIILFSFVSIGEKVVSIAFYFHYEYLTWKEEASELNTSLFAVLVRVTCHTALAIMMVGELATSKGKKVASLPFCVIIFVAQFLSISWFFNTEVKEEIHDKEAFLLLTTTSVFNMTLLTVFCLYLGFPSEKTKRVNKIVGFHAIIDILHNFLIQCLLATNNPVHPSALILVNYAKDLFFMFIYVVRVMNASIVEVSDADSISSVSHEDLDITIVDTPRSEVEMVKY